MEEVGSVEDASSSGDNLRLFLDRSSSIAVYDCELLPGLVDELSLCEVEEDEEASDPGIE